MMKTKPTRLELMQYADGTLPEPQRRALEEAVAASPALQRELRLLRSIDSAVRTAPMSAPGAAFTDRVLNEVLPTPHHPVRSFLEEYSSGIFAMTLVAAMLLLVLTSAPATDRGIIPSISRSYTAVYDAAAHAVTGPWKELRQSFRQLSVPASGRFMMLGLFMLGVAAGVDSLLFRRPTRVRFDR